jgi:hypothetical protein
MGTSIGDLPVELLTAIFHRVHASSHNTLVACIGCCRHWKDLAEPILWRNVFLRFHNSRRFSAQIGILISSEQGRSKLNTVRCLRIAVPGNGRDYIGGVHDHNPDEDGGSLGPCQDTAGILAIGISGLVGAVPHLSNLQTFQIMVYNGVKMNGPDDFLGSITHRERTAGPCPDMFAKLLDVLPPSVRDLYLDLSDAPRRYPHSACQICPAINRIVPRLEHLALYLRTCCDHVLVPTNSNEPYCPKLKSIIVRLQGFHSKNCSYPRNLARLQSVPFDVNKYGLLIRNARKNGAFPSLQSFLIISKWRAAGANSQDLTCRWAVYVKDIACNQTVVFPRVFLEKPHAVAPGVTRTYSPRAFIRIPTSCSFMPSWRLGKEYVGGSGGIRRLVRLLSKILRQKD